MGLNDVMIGPLLSNLWHLAYFAAVRIEKLEGDLDAMELE
jgi:hypothetical protein